MKPSLTPLMDKGMSRDLSASKAQADYAWDNHNVRVEARDGDTLLSVTNERGNAAVEGVSVPGTVVGWAALGDHLLLFATESEEGAYLSDGYDGAGGTPDRLVRIDCDPQSGSFSQEEVYAGRLGLDVRHPVEAVAHYETEEIQKAYWVDGVHVLRSVNFMAGAEERATWDDTSFDSDREVRGDLSGSVSKDQAGDTRANGVVQYFVTYYNENGQQTGRAWTSDLVYLAPEGTGGSPDGTNHTRVAVALSGWDTTFDKWRLHALVRTSLGASATGHLVAEGDVPSSADEEVTVYDTGSYLSDEDPDSYLYLGSRAVVAGTLAHKDGTLFLGDLRSVGRRDTDAIEEAIHATMFEGGAFEWGASRESSCVSFRLTDEGDTGSWDGSIPLEDTGGLYPYDSQLRLTSSRILSFKGGELYRFALRFVAADGTSSDAFWIGDKENGVWPEVTDACVRRVVADCAVPAEVSAAAVSAGWAKAELMVAEATYSDRAVLAQGVVLPTVFNVLDREQGTLYAQASWMARPRNSGFAWRHNSPLSTAQGQYGELQCNWWDGDEPTPWYTLDADGGIADELPGATEDWDAFIVFYKIKYAKASQFGSVWLLTYTGDIGDLPTMDEVKSFVHDATDDSSKVRAKTREAGGGFMTLWHQQWTKRKRWKTLWNHVWSCLDDWGLPTQWRVPSSTFKGWCSLDERGDTLYFNEYGGVVRADGLDALLDGAMWTSGSGAVDGTRKYRASYFKRHLFFVDENVVTFDSPELTYEALTVDRRDVKVRFVGVAPLRSSFSDYTVDATASKWSGSNVAKETLSHVGGTGNDGLQARALFVECGVALKTDEEGDEDEDIYDTDPLELGYDHFEWQGGCVKYLLHMWHKGGCVAGMGADDDGNTWSELTAKCFANEWVCGGFRFTEPSRMLEVEPDCLRHYTYTTGQRVGVDTGAGSVLYDANIDTAVNVPGTFRYPVWYVPAGATSLSALSYTLGSSDSVRMQYATSAHAVLSLGAAVDGKDVAYTVLPELTEARADAGGYREGTYLPWAGERTEDDEEGRTWRLSQGVLGGLEEYAGTQYLLMAELVADTGSGAEDTRYGGCTRAAVEACTYAVAGPQSRLDGGAATLLGNAGDTYIQRFDDYRVKRWGEDAVNQVVDVVSFWCETHVDIDGRYDLLRGSTLLASLPDTGLGDVNDVYSARDGWFAGVDQGGSADLDSWRQSVTWTGTKADGADVDEWTHVTLASSLQLDGDKGPCRALRRFRNQLLAFQDRGVAEVLYNSSTPITTDGGVPVELANSGKVDGKRYLTERWGCLNKWSVVEGKDGLYFKDDTGGEICKFDGRGVASLTSQCRLGAWVRRDESMEEWDPATWANAVSFYDPEHSDVYFVRSAEGGGDEQCLVYSEQLGSFAGFFDYGGVPCMAHVGGRFVSVRDGRLWLQNAGAYCSFFGEPRPWWVTWRVCPEPYGDKVWTNVEYRADFFDAPGGESPESADSGYLPWRTFDRARFWDEHQDTGWHAVRQLDAGYPCASKKFRVWRLDIPRDADGDGSPSLDRMRNPWLAFTLRCEPRDGASELMQLHDATVKHWTR